MWLDGAPRLRKDPAHMSVDEVQPTAETAAEDAMAYAPLRTSGVREQRSGVVLTDHGMPHHLMRNATRLRLDDDADAAIAEIRAWFRERGAVPFTWFLGPSTTPNDLADRLIATGARPHEDGGGTALVLDTPPAPGPAHDIREVTTFADFVVQQELLWQVAEKPPEVGAALRERLPGLWEEIQAGGGRHRGWLASLGGEPVSAGTLALTTNGFGLLGGGATRADARGKGCYAALVRHRWAVAQELGLPALIVQASSQSRPVLERLGFRVVAALTMLVDEG